MMEKSYQQFLNDWKQYCFNQEFRFIDFLQMCYDNNLYSAKELNIYVREMNRDGRFPYLPVHLLKEFEDEN